MSVQCKSKRIYFCFKLLLTVCLRWNKLVPNPAISKALTAYNGVEGRIQGTARLSGFSLTYCRELAVQHRKVTCPVSQCLLARRGNVLSSSFWADLLAMVGVKVLLWQSLKQNCKKKIKPSDVQPNMKKMLQQITQSWFCDGLLLPHDAAEDKGWLIVSEWQKKSVKMIHAKWALKVEAAAAVL